jgi:hypothetical protein
MLNRLIIQNKGRKLYRIAVSHSHNVTYMIIKIVKWILIEFIYFQFAAVWDLPRVVSLWLLNLSFLWYGPDNPCLAKKNTNN